MSAPRSGFSPKSSGLASAAALLSVAAVLLGCAAPAPSPRYRPADSAPPAPASVPESQSEPPSRPALELLGEAELPARPAHGGAILGGLSSLTYDAERDLYYAISDDPASKGPARFYSLTVDLTGGALDVEVVGMTELLDRDGRPFGEMTCDLEGIELGPRGTIFVSSEGQVSQGVDPFLREYTLGGTFVRDLGLPEKFLPRASGTNGIRHNLGFESVSLAPGGRWLFTATENALEQDGKKADFGVASHARLLRFDLESNAEPAEYVYVVEPVADASVANKAFRTRGLVELLALDASRLLALERAYTDGVGNAVELFLVSLDAATDVGPWPSLTNRSYRAVAKKSVLKLEEIGVELDNLEGMALGPRLGDGRRSLLMIADDNFSSFQRNQVLAFALEERDSVR